MTPEKSLNNSLNRLFIEWGVNRLPVFRVLGWCSLLSKSRWRICRFLASDSDSACRNLPGVKFWGKSVATKQVNLGILKKLFYPIPGLRQRSNESDPPSSLTLLRRLLLSEYLTQKSSYTSFLDTFEVLKSRKPTRQGFEVIFDGIWGTP